MGEAVCELYGCGCEATKFGFARMCDSCYANVTKELREQITRGIVAYHNDPKSCHKDYRHCECEVYLAIARGEK